MEFISSIEINYVGHFLGFLLAELCWKFKKCLHFPVLSTLKVFCSWKKKKKKKKVSLLSDPAYAGSVYKTVH